MFVKILKNTIFAVQLEKYFKLLSYESIKIGNVVIQVETIMNNVRLSKACNYEKNTYTYRIQYI